MTNQGHRRHQTSLDIGAVEMDREATSRSPTIHWAAYELDLPVPKDSIDETYPQPMDNDEDDDTAVFGLSATLMRLFKARKFCSPGNGSSSRRFMLSSIGTIALLSIPTTSAMALQAAASPIEGRGGRVVYQARVEGAGAGFDLFTLKPTVTDVIYLPSLVGVWQCQREVLQVDGDTEQAQEAWVALGGLPGDFKKPTATYLTRYINGTDGLVLDRGFEVQSRQRKDGGVVSWEVTQPDSLAFGSTELCVVQRSVEPPSDEGWGCDELVRITTAAGGIFGDTKVVKVARVKRRYRRAYADSGDRIIEGLEIVKTYRVLDGIAGELPTSTTKSRIQMTRPP